MYGPMMNLKQERDHFVFGYFRLTSEIIEIDRFYTKDALPL